MVYKSIYKRQGWCERKRLKQTKGWVFSMECWLTFRRNKEGRNNWDRRLLEDYQLTLIFSSCCPLLLFSEPSSPCELFLPFLSLATACKIPAHIWDTTKFTVLRNANPHQMKLLSSCVWYWKMEPGVNWDLWATSLHPCQICFWIWRNWSENNNNNIGFDNFWQENQLASKIPRTGMFLIRKLRPFNSSSFKLSTDPVSFDVLRKSSTSFCLT